MNNNFTILDRCHIGMFNLYNIKNVKSHDMNVALLCAKMSNIVYTIKDSSNPHGVDWVPDAQFREEFGSSGVSPPKLFDFFENRDNGEMEHFIVFVPGGAALGIRYGDTIIVAFRGTTENSGDWGVNLYGTGLGGPAVVRYNFAFTNYGKSFIHAGFRSIAKALSLAIQKPLDDFINKIEYGKRKVLFCGHSLGGALALLAGQPKQENPFCYDLPYSQSVDAIYTFGAPMVGDIQSARLLDNVHFRYVLKGDIVPTLPPFSGFAHEIPCIELNPYDFSPNPGFWGKIKKGWNEAKGMLNKSEKAIIEVLSAEHDIGLYIKTIDEVLHKKKVHP